MSNDSSQTSENTYQQYQKKYWYAINNVFLQGTVVSLLVGAFTWSDISHLLPVINIERDTALLRQKDHTVF